jgi:hypothetical protein
MGDMPPTVIPVDDAEPDAVFEPNRFDNAVRMLVPPPDELSVTV